MIILIIYLENQYPRTVKTKIRQYNFVLFSLSREGQTELQNLDFKREYSLLEVLNSIVSVLIYFASENLNHILLF